MTIPLSFLKCALRLSNFEDEVILNIDDSGKIFQIAYSTPFTSCQDEYFVNLFICFLH